MSGGAPQVAYVLMPERGMFLVCLPEGFDSPYGTRCVVHLDYGEDVAEVRCAATYSPEIHGTRIPGFRLIRPLAPEDDARLAANEDLAESMCVTFLKLAAAEGHALRIVHRRLSFGRERLFIRFATEEKSRPDLSHPCAEIKRLFGATVNAWQLGPRDEVALTGALGPCGRRCCCCDWQSRYPQGLTADRIRAHGVMSGGQNGICGRYRCCLAFE
jgi:cell fate regulator YaaT (PSP1 superfamily)